MPQSACGYAIYNNIEDEPVLLIDESQRTVYSDPLEQVEFPFILLNCMVIAQFPIAWILVSMGVQITPHFILFATIYAMCLTGILYRWVERHNIPKRQKFRDNMAVIQGVIAGEALA